MQSSAARLPLHSGESGSVAKITYPVTVRDAQRFVSSGHYWRWEPEYHALSVDIDQALGVSRHGYKDVTLQALARYAAQHGADAVLLASPEAESSPTSDREHKIGTDEVAEQSENPSEDSEMHGGDSASGEVESGTSEGGDNQSGASSDTTAQAHTGAGTGGGEMGSGAGDTGAQGNALSPTSANDEADDKSVQSAAETGNTSAGAVTSRGGEGNGPPRADAQAENGHTAESAPAEKSETAGGNASISSADSAHTQSKNDADHAAHASDACSAALTGGANADLSADASSDGQGKDTSDVETTSESYHYRSSKRGGGQQVSTSANKNFGGATASLKRAGIDPRIASQARKVLARLLEGGESETGPRWDYTEFCKRLKTARSVYPARKEEEGRPAILVLADVSGSCSGFSDESVAVAKAVATMGVSGTDVIVITHSNGYPTEIQVNQTAPVDVTDVRDNEAVAAWYENVLKRYDIQAVVAMGDWDAEWLYRNLAHLPRVTKLVWLDNWSCNNLDQPVLRQDMFQKAQGLARADYYTPWEFSGPWSRSAQAKTRYVVGCKDAAHFVRGLEIALKGK